MGHWDAAPARCHGAELSMALRTVPIRRVAHRDNLFMGGDRELVLFSGGVTVALILTAQTMLALVVGLTVWVVVLYVLRLMAKADPKMRGIYLRSLIYQPYYPARSTPWRVNTSRQGKQYS